MQKPRYFTEILRNSKRIWWLQRRCIPEGKTPHQIPKMVFLERLLPSLFTIYFADAALLFWIENLRSNEPLYPLISWCIEMLIEKRLKIYYSGKANVEFNEFFRVLIWYWKILKINQIIYKFKKLMGSLSIFMFLCFELELLLLSQSNSSALFRKKRLHLTSVNFLFHLIAKEIWARRRFLFLNAIFEVSF